MKKLRSEFAHLMAKKEPPQPQHDAELAELKTFAKNVPQLYAEITHLKSALQASKGGTFTAQTGQPVPTRTTPKIKDVMCSKFGGQEVYPTLGAGFEDFILEYEQAIATEALLNQSRWTSQIKASVLVNFLEDKAARFFHSNVTQWRIEKSDFNYEDFKSKLRVEFGCKLNQVQLNKRLTCYKRPQDSWSEYLDYLKYVNRLMAGDHSLLLLETFCSNACPELSSTLTARVDRSNSNYLLEADRILSLLVNLRGDGRKRGPPGRPASDTHDKKSGSHSHQKSHQPKNQNGQGEAFVASTKPTTKFVCYICDEEGHRGFECPDLHLAKAAVKPQGQAHNVTAATNDTQSAPISNDLDASSNNSEAFLWYVATPNDVNQPQAEWILDSGATHHMCTDRNLLFGTEPANLTIQVANSATMTSTLKGNCLLETTVNGDKRSILLTNVYYCEALGRNLLSLSQLRRRGLNFTFADKCTFHSRDGSVVGEATEHEGLWIINANTLCSSSSNGYAYFVNVQNSSLQKWHERLGHVNYQDLLRMASRNLAYGISLANKKATFCMACAEGKQSRNMSQSKTLPTQLLLMNLAP
ncbi:Ty1-Copia Retrotransposon protein [Phytophthora megakarya]|uniref:Ty1-Copia Retrotransposon protein n=1 Tax=Phytophthora megakarya TaxID=4795 RepID=A0A225VND0_9STRA|nr:Ty1-Copia Retrotransposon protein [Phytophthora megakarya]